MPKYFLKNVNPLCNSSGNYLALEDGSEIIDINDCDIAVVRDKQAPMSKINKVFLMVDNDSLLVSSDVVIDVGWGEDGSYIKVNTPVFNFTSEIADFVFYDVDANEVENYQVLATGIAGLQYSVE